MDFLQFCAQGPEGFTALRQRVDACAQLGRSYEFRQCRLPQGCRPARTDLGFWRQEGRYFLYLRPAVDYAGPDPRLSDFFQQAIRPFPCFQAMEQLLLSLPGPQPAPPRADPAPTDKAQGQGGFARLRRLLGQRVVGQEEAVDAAAFKLYGHVSKRTPARPLSLIFYGPSGVGKSELGKAIAPVLNAYLGVERFRLVWTELNTFTEAHSVYRLTGAPPGYAGYDDPAVLEQVQEHPHTVFMFDELDKAHPEVLKVFMSILDEGRCAPRSAAQQELDFRRCVLLFTTNTDLSRPHGPALGFAPPDPPAPEQSNPSAGPAGGFGLARRLYAADERARRALIRSGVLTEIAGRFGGLIGFRPLTGQDRAAVTARQIAALGREFGLELVHIDPGLTQALTPADGLSLRSTAAVLEGVLTPLFSTCGEGGRFRLEGTEDRPRLSPVP